MLRRFVKILFTLEWLPFIALLLFFSIAAHEVSFGHDHPHHVFGEGVQAVFHGDSRKWWLWLLLAAGTPWLSARRYVMPATALEQSLLVSSHQRTLRTILLKLFDPILILLRRGILCPKLYERA
jgi:hypothetical protein